MTKTPKNVCGADRAGRIVFGLLAVATGIFRLFGGGAVGYLIIALGIILFATGAVGRCRLYVPFGFSSCRDSEPDK